MALILSIETSAATCSVALHQGGELIAERVVPEKQAHAAQLAVSIHDLLKEEGLTSSALSAVAVSSGPGSYTGLRIGASTAKGLCFGLSIPLIALPTLSILANALSQDKRAIQGAVICPMIDARRMEVFCQFFDQSGRPIGDIIAQEITTESFTETLQRSNLLFGGDAIEKCKPVISHPNAHFVDDVIPLARMMGTLAWRKWQAKDFEDVVHFTPVYAKDFIAKKAASYL